VGSTTFPGIWASGCFHSILGGYITVTVVMRYAQLPLAQLDSSCMTPSRATHMMLLAQRSVIRLRVFFTRLDAYINQ